MARQAVGKIVRFWGENKEEDLEGLPGPASDKTQKGRPRYGTCLLLLPNHLRYRLLGYF